MRYFPNAPRERLAALMAGTVALGALAIPIASADDLKNKQKQVESQVEQAHDELEGSSLQVQEATAAFEQAKVALADAKGALGAVRGELAAAQERDREAQAALLAAELKLAAASEDLAEGRAALVDQHIEVTDTVMSIYEQGDPQLLAFASLLDAESPEDLTRRLEANTIIVGQEVAAYDGLYDAQVALRARATAVEEAKVEVADKRRDAADNLVVVEGLLVEARAARARVDALVEPAREARRAAWSARQRDRAILERLREREEQIRQQILAEAREAREARGPTGGYRGEVGGGFLDYPVDGYVTSSFGYRTHPIYGYWGLHDGTDFGAACDQPLRAVADGTVMSSYYSSVYGNRLYLNLGLVNGRNITVVYNHMSQAGLAEGSSVNRGDVVGYVGSTGWSTGCHLHFTVLVNGDPVDPMNWI